MQLLFELIVHIRNTVDLLSGKKIQKHITKPYDFTCYVMWWLGDVKQLFRFQNTTVKYV